MFGTVAGPDVNKLLLWELISKVKHWVSLVLDVLVKSLYGACKPSDATPYGTMCLMHPIPVLLKVNIVL